jgi:hypothetical protein
MSSPSNSSPVLAETLVGSGQNPVRLSMLRVTHTAEEM